jgi:hypothetical protein
VTGKTFGAREEFDARARRTTPGAGVLPENRGIKNKNEQWRHRRKRKGNMSEILNQHMETVGVNTDLADPTDMPVGATNASAGQGRAAAKTLRDECLCLLQSADLTADECAGRLQVSVLSIRPRISELRTLGQVFKTDVRRQNRSGHSAAVWSGQRS